MTVTDQPADQPDELEHLADVVQAMPKPARRAWLLRRTPGEMAVVRRAMDRRTGGRGVYRTLGYEPICIPRVKAALAAGYPSPLEAEADGMPGLPEPCGECPAERFDAATEEDVLFGGAAGGSKTKSSVMLVVRLMKLYPGLRALFLRETYDQLDENVYPELRAIDYAAEIGGKWNAGRRQLDIGPSACRFRYLADMGDALQRRGGSYQLIVFDERNLLPPRVADVLRDRLRSADPNVPVIGFRSTANPGGRGHGELKQGYVKPDPRTYDVVRNAAGDVITTVARGASVYKRRFIPAKATDNPYLGDDYYEKVLGGIEDPVLRAAMQDGDWDVFVGQYFGEWRDARHVVPRDALEIMDHWPRVEGIDYGRAAPWCMLRGAVDGDGRVWLYRELYRTGLGEREQAAMIAADEDRFGDTDAARWGDPSMWNKVNDAPAIADTYAELGVKMEPANHDRLQGWARVHSFLAENEPCPYHASLGWATCPMLHVLDATCPNLVRTLPDLPFDQHKVEDLDTDAEDHAADALRYMLMHVKAPRPRRRLAGEAQRGTEASTV